MPDHPTVKVSSNLSEIKRSLDSELDLGDSEASEELTKEPLHSAEVAAARGDFVFLIRYDLSSKSFDYSKSELNRVPFIF